MEHHVTGTPEEIAWAAGVIEGDGYIYAGTEDRGWSTGRRHLTYIVSVAMTDLDIVERLKRVFGRGTLNGPYLYKSSLGNKPMYRWRVGAKRDVCHVIELIRPWLGLRRGERADEVLLALYTT